ncbi:MAG: hypothetical protein AAF541_03520 [Pseudomonadota bacterium]
MLKHTCRLVLAVIAGFCMATNAVAEVDLTGTYNIATLTPLQRPAQFGDRASITKEEAKEIADYWASNLAKDSAPSDPDRDAPAKGGTEIYVPEFEGAAGGVGGYNAFYVDIGESNFSLDGKYRTSIITYPENGRLPKLSPAAIKRFQEAAKYRNENTGTAWWLERGVGPYDNPENRPLAERCILGFGSTAGPPALPVMYNNLKRIVQTDSHVIIINEMNHDARVVRLDSTHLPPEQTSWLGDSIGHWEGDTLVVNTRNFNYEPGLFMATSQLHVEERFSRIDENTLRYSFTVNDPTWVEPWRGEYPWPASNDKIFEYACHEGNYALGGILRGARVLEAEAMAAAASGEE